MKNEQVMNEQVIAQAIPEGFEPVAVEETTGALMKMDMNSLMNAENNFYCSIENDGSRAAKVAIYNAIADAKEKLDDHINMELKIVDVVAHPVEIVDERTGEVNSMIRTILIDEKGVGYAAVSYGVLSSLQRIFGIVGKPSWKDEPLVIVPKKQDTRNGNKVTTLALK